jgi:fibronectin type 3 domain-containing protein
MPGMQEARVAWAAQTRICVFNFTALDLESAHLGTTASQMLSENYRSKPNYYILDKKELEQFLTLNDLQQNDNVDNMASIGSRLGLDIVVTGSIGRSGQVVMIYIKAVQVSQKKIIFNTQARAFGEAGLSSEMKEIGDKLAKAIESCNIGMKKEDDFTLEPPGSLETRPGSESVLVRWHCAPGKASGFKIYRATAESGPFTNVANVKTSEYLDQGLEKKKAYYYKVRAYDERGLQSGFSAVVRCETEAVPNPPIIIRAEGHIKSIHLTFSPNPARSEDPLKVAGFKLYRATAEEGPYVEMVKLTGGDLAASEDQSNVRVNYIDKGLNDSETWFYKLTAINEKGLESEYSMPVKRVTLPAVSGLTAAGGMIREVHLSWDRLNSPYVTAYNIYRSVSESRDFVMIRNLDNKSAGPEEARVNFIDTANISDLTTYYYRVTAVETPEMETSVSKTVSALTRGKPPVPAGLRAESGQVKQVDLAWEQSPQEEVRGYKLYRSTQGSGNFTLIKKLDGRTENRFTDEGKGPEYDFSFGKKLEDGRTYFYCLTTFNKVEVESENSAVVSAVTKPRPSAPKGLKPEITQGKDGPMKGLSWAGNPEKDIDYYAVYEKTETGLKKVTTTRDLSHFEKSLPPGKGKTFAVTAVDRDGLESDPSPEIVLSN